MVSNGKAFDKRISIIRHRGEPNKATTLSGESVERLSQLFVDAEGYNRFYPVTHYDDHFIYDNPTIAQPSFMCTCGAPAVLVPPDGPEAKLVCLYHQQHEVHATGGSRWQ